MFKKDVKTNSIEYFDTNLEFDSDTSVEDGTNRIVRESDVCICVFNELIHDFGL